MPFPETPRVVYDKNPLTQVIAELRFPPILKIGAEDPAPFQDRLRRDYPLYRRAGTAADLPPQIAGLIKQLNIGSALETPSHAFSTEDGLRTVTLARDSLAVETKAYRTWEDFGSRVNEARTALEEIYQPSFYTRIGLRYVDVIDRRNLGLEGDAWSDLINRKLIGLLAATEITDEVSEILSVASIRLSHTAGASVRLQHGIQSKQVAPSDVPHSVYVVDADFSTQERSACNNVPSVLGGFNRVAGNLFRWAITPRLTSALGPRPMD